VQFEELLAGRDIETLTDEEVEEMIAKMKPSELEKFDKKISAKKVRGPSKTQLNAEDLVNQLIAKGRNK